MDEEKTAKFNENIEMSLKIDELTSRNHNLETENKSLSSKISHGLDEIKISMDDGEKDQLKKEEEFSKTN